MATELKRIDWNTQTSFEANGRTYRLSNGMNPKRFAEFQIAEVEAGFSMTYRKLFDELGLLREDINGIQFVGAAIRVDNMQRGIAYLETKQPILLRICALILNYDGEDVTHYSEEMIAQKIADWNEFDVKDFFTLALNKLDGYINDYTNVSRTISAQDKKAGQNLKEEVASTYKGKKAKQ